MAKENNKLYQRIWVEHNGPIPFDEHGRSYEIHHLNGDRSDSRLENLQCVSIEEHYAIHLAQGDFLAAAAIARRMAKSVEHLSDLNRAAGYESLRRMKGIHAMSEEDRKAAAAKGRANQRGMGWFNNGEEERKFREPPGPEWKSGRITSCGFEKGRILGTFWNDGIRNMRSIECPGEGWVSGRILNEEQRERRSNVMRGRKVSEETKNKRAASLRKKWTVVHPDGREEIITGLKEFCAIHGLNPSIMSRVAKNILKHHKGFICYANRSG